MYVTGLALTATDADAPWSACRSAIRQAGAETDASVRTQYVVLGYGGSVRSAEDVDDDIAMFCGELAIDRLRQRGADALLFNHACSSALFAIEYGQVLMRTGRIDRLVITGMLGPTEYDRAGMGVLRALGKGRPRPFAPDRDGTALGAGQYALVCDSEESVSRRGAAAFARVASISCRVVAEPRAGLRPAAVHDRMVDALDRAGVRAPDRIEAHATGTVVGDAAEEKAIAMLFAERDIDPRDVVVSASKATTGHLLHGSGVVSMVESCRAAVAARDTVLVNAFGFSGNYACAVMRPVIHGVVHDLELVPELVPLAVSEGCDA